MQRKQVYVLLIFLGFFSAASVSLPLFFSDTSTYDAWQALKIQDYEPYDTTSKYEGKTILDFILKENMHLSTADVDPEEIWIVPVIDDFTGEVYDQEFECVLKGVDCNIWIGLNPDIWEGGFQDEYDPRGEGFEDDIWYFAYPWSSIGIDAKSASAPDPDNDGYYLPPDYRDWVTGEDLLHICSEFDNNIHDMVLEHFGEYAYREGPLEDGKIQVLIFNMRDGLFYDPITAGWFVMGYFWSYASEINDANIFHMDTYQWWRRLGTPTDEYFGLGPLPLQYEGTFAHEFQHLVHYDVDSTELSWVNEGCSTLAEWICGYGFSPGHISEYLLYFWDTSLVVWQGYLSDYGVVFLWTYYMWEHYGGDAIIWDLVHEQTDGIQGWANVLENHKIEKSFDEIFQDWALANYLDDTTINGGIYGYYNLDIPSADSEGYSISSAMEMWEAKSNTPAFDWLVRSYPNEGLPYPYGVSLPYVANYVEFSKGGDAYIDLTFDGDDYCGVEAYSGDYKWYSGGEGWAWYRLGENFDIPITGAILNFWTYYEIEAEWDFGYVEVYDYNTDLWCTLPGINTVSDIGFNDKVDNPNCPGNSDDWGLEPTGYSEAGVWNAFTGSSGGWYEETMDLTPFTGHKIDLYFTYWTDPYTLEAGWYIDDIQITEIGFFDNIEEGTGSWTVNDGWTRDNSVHDNNFEVNLITIKNCFEAGSALFKTTTHLSAIDLNDETEFGITNFELVDRAFVQQYVVMVITNQPGYEHTFTSSYSFTALKK
jgi:hypothetical protein